MSNSEHPEPTAPTGRFLWLDDLGRDARFALRSLARTPQLTGAGIGVGLAGALALTSVLSRLLYGVSARDPLTYAALAILLALVALLATWLPAWRASRVDPILAIRRE